MAAIRRRSSSSATAAAAAAAAAGKQVFLPPLMLMLVLVLVTILVPTPVTAAGRILSGSKSYTAYTLAPNVIDVDQCTSRRYYQKGVFLLSNANSEGCYLNAFPDFAVWTRNNSNGKLVVVNFKDSDWTLEARKPSAKDVITRGALGVEIANSRLGRRADGNATDAQPLRGVEALRRIRDAEGITSDNAIERSEKTLQLAATSSNSQTRLTLSTTSTSGRKPNAPLELDIAFSRYAIIPKEFWEKVDQGLMAFELIIRNVLNPLDDEGWFLQYSFNQTVEMAWSMQDSFAKVDAFKLNFTSTTYSDPLTSFRFTGPIPKDQRSVYLAVQSNYPYYAAGQISMLVYQDKLEYQRLATVVFNITFFTALGFVLLCPMILIAEQVIRRKRRRIAIRVVDLVHTQGPRYVRAATYTAMMALLYFVLQWIRATSSTDDAGVIPLDIFPEGLSAKWFASQPSLKTLKAVVFIGLFLIVGAFFWPMFITYAHASEGSRTASILGVLVSTNLVLLRASMEYLNTKPAKGFDRKIIQEIPEVICYCAILGYFCLNSYLPSWTERRFQKTYLKDYIHVRTLLRPTKVPETAEARPAKRRTLFDLHPDNRPVWLRGSKPTTMFQEFSIFFRDFRMPVRLVASILMMCLFTYVLLVAQLYSILDSNSRLSCSCGLFGAFYIEKFATVFELLGQMTGAQSFGSPLADTLRDLFPKIRDETDGAGFVGEFFDLLKASVLMSMGLSALLLAYNTIDFAQAVQRDMRRIRVGDYTRVGDYLLTSTSLAVQFVGTQVGYVYMGTLYMMTILLILCFILLMFFKYAFFRELVWRFAFQNGLVIISIAIGFLLVVVQRVTVESYFVAKLEKSPEEHADPANAHVNKKGKVVIDTKYWLSKKVGYNQVDFWFLFPNLITGLLSFVANLITMILGSALYAYRLDKKTEYTLPFLGSKSAIYFSWLLQEHHHTNPILVIFVKLLTDWYHIDRPVATANARKERAKRRWQLLYTLHKNPSLQAFRKHRVRETLLRNFIATVEFPQVWEQDLRKRRADLEKTEAPLRPGMRERERAVRELYEELERNQGAAAAGAKDDKISRQRTVLARGLTVAGAPQALPAFHPYYQQPQQGMAFDQKAAYQQPQQAYQQPAPQQFAAQPQGVVMQQQQQPPQPPQRPYANPASFAYQQPHSPAPSYLTSGTYTPTMSTPSPYPAASQVPSSPYPNQYTASNPYPTQQQQPPPSAWGTASAGSYGVASPTTPSSASFGDPPQSIAPHLGSAGAAGYPNMGYQGAPAMQQQQQQRTPPARGHSMRLQAEYGKISSELITAAVCSYMNKVQPFILSQSDNFQIIGIVADTGGDVIKFLGDAIIVSFPATAPEQRIEQLKNALVCALFILTRYPSENVDVEALKNYKNAHATHAATHQSGNQAEFSSVTSAGKKKRTFKRESTMTSSKNSAYSLRLHIALIAGDGMHVILGDPETRMDYNFYSDSFEDLKYLINGAEAGEIAVQGSAWQTLLDLLHIPKLQGVKHLTQGAILDTNTVNILADHLVPEEQPDRVSYSSEMLAATADPSAANFIVKFINESVAFQFLGDAKQGLTSQYRTICCLFVKILGKFDPFVAQKAVASFLTTKVQLF
ncbi:hypothetical protein HDU96_006731 [Phlyctochytrium bullatum]|nr:hypothetical protein HDU96_006731 [Phlyctochytrium bullatum]